MQEIQVGNNTLQFQEAGSGETTLLLMTGWCQDDRLYRHVIPLLAEHYHVLQVNYRGHREGLAYDGEFGAAELIEDMAAVLDLKGVKQAVPISCSHGGWVNIGLAEKLGIDRIPRCIVTDWAMNPPQEFHDGIKRGQTDEHWSEVRNHLYKIWIGGSRSQDVIDHCYKEFEEYGQEMWVRSCRVIEGVHNEWETPLKRIMALAPSRPVAHIFSQPATEEYEALHKQAAEANPWFTYYRLQPGVSHFPTLESPAAYAAAVRDFVG